MSTEAAGVAAAAAANNDDEEEESNTARRICQQARSLWLEATRPEDLIQVENMYRQVWEQSEKGFAGDDDEDKEEPEQDSKKRRLLLDSTTTVSSDTNTGSTKMSCTTTRQQAGERLAMLLLQSGRTRQADAILKRCRMPRIKCRLSTQILAYHDTIQAFHNANNKDNNNNKHKTFSGNSNGDTVTIPCRIYDNFLSVPELEFLQNVFYQPTSLYWTCHNYAVEPPSPYFSHIIPLNNNGILEKEFGGLGTIIRRIQTIITQGVVDDDNDDDEHTKKATTTIQKPFAPLVQRCTHVEMWAHNRPHATGHQLHFDSDNEGQGDRIRHPVVSCILYLSSSSSSTTTGSTGSNVTTTIMPSSSSSSSSSPPSLITNQRRVSHRAADKGWLIEPKLRRLAVFDGRVLHGVLPGQGVLSSSSESESSTPTRRVTLMLAFWRHIQVRSTASSPQPQPSSSVDQAAAAAAVGTPATAALGRRRRGAAQPFPMNSKKANEGSDTLSCSRWAWQLCQPLLTPSPQFLNGTANSSSSSSSSSKPTLADPIPLDHVYETLDGQPWSHKLGMPEYNEVFQGF